MTIAAARGGGGGGGGSMHGGNRRASLFASLSPARVCTRLSRTAAAALVCALAMTAHTLLAADTTDLAAIADAQVAFIETASSSSNIAADKLEQLEAWYKGQFSLNEAQLVGYPNTELQGLMPTGDRPCRDLPSIQLRSTIVATNNGCPAFFKNLNASCTCLTGFLVSPESWTLKVKPKSDTTQLSLYQRPNTTYEVNSISTLWVNESLTTLRILGDSEEPLSIKFVSDNRAAATNELPIARSTSTSFQLQTLEIANIDLDDVTRQTKNFVPTSVTHLTLRNVNLKEPGIDFARSLNNVEILDWSSNKLRFPYVGKQLNPECFLCQVREANLSYNQIVNFTDDLFRVSSLKKLYVQGNNLDFRVSPTTFAAIQSLDAFLSDAPDARMLCTDGAWQTAHGVQFCVVASALTPVAGVMTPSTSHATSSYLIYAVGGGGVVVVLLLLGFVVREKWWKKQREQSKRDGDDRVSMFVDTYDFDNSHATPETFLVNDPLIVTARIPYSEVHTGQCISKGGFGLVFVGSYNGRKVAIKKIRPDLSDDLAQIELFAKEIALMAMLEHPRIVEFIGVAWDSLRHLSAVTEFMDRGDLRDVLQGFKTRGCRLTWATHKLPIAEHIAEALTYLHSLRPKKVIHRDLKSKNVLLNSDMEAKLSDFGISRERRFEETHMTAGIGTSFWIAPEVLLGKDYDERADIFSFGVVLCEIDTDDYPYWNDKNPSRGGQLQQAEILRQVALGALRPTFADDCPQAILALADSCLQADPAERPTAAEIVYELQRIFRERLLAT